MAENFQNFYVTKLREACDASATTIYVETIPTITEGTLVIEYASSTKHEIIHFTGRSGYSLTGCTRGYEGTTAQSHSAGVDVRQNVTAGILDKITNRAITTENIADEAVTSDKIDWTTLPEHTQVAIGTVSSSGAITLPSGYDVYRISGNIQFGTSSASSGIVMSLSNYSGTSKVQRLLCTSDDVEQFTGQYTDGRVLIFGSGGALGTSSGGLNIDMMISKTTVTNKFNVSCTWNHTTVISWGITTGEFYTSDSSSPISLSFLSNSSSRSFSNPNIVITGMKSA